MNEALWLLLWLRFHGFLRRIGRGLKTVKGALVAVVLGLFVLSYAGGAVMGLVVVRAMPSKPTMRAITAPGGKALPAPEAGEQSQEMPRPESMRRWVALGLLAYSVMVLISGSAQHTLAFSPAEVCFLFPGPFSRRQLLAYKLVQPVLLALPFVFFVGTSLAMIAGTISGAYLGLFLVLIYLQLFAVAVHLIGEYAGAWASGLGRKLVLAILIVVIGAGLVLTWRDAPVSRTPTEWLAALEQSPPVRVLMTPLFWFADLFAARQIWPDMVLSAGRALGIDLLLLVLVFALDASFLEAAAASSAKVYAKLERMRSGSFAAAFSAPTGKPPRLTLPDFPTWGGAGVVLWRQMLTGLRSLKGLSIFLLIIGCTTCGPLLVATLTHEKRMPGPAFAGLLVSIVGMLSLLMTQALAFDFRTDYERMDTLKALPINSVGVVLGQLATPVLLATLLQLAACLLIYALVPDTGVVPLVAGAFLLPVNVLSLGIDNLLFLIFPTRLVAASPGDLRTGLRQAILMLAKFVLIGTAAGVACGVAALVYFVFGRSWPLTLAAAWVVVAIWCVPVVPLCALAFRHFDVSRDMG